MIKNFIFKNSDKYFSFYDCCFMTKGFARSLIVDSQRNKLRLIPNDLYDIIKLSKLNTIGNIFRIYGKKNEKAIIEYLNTLLREEYGELVDFVDKRFTTIPTSINSHREISNAIVDIREKIKIDLMSVINDLEELGCNALQIRIYDTKNNDRKLGELADALKSTSINFIEILLNESIGAHYKFCKKLLLEYYSLSKIILYSSKMEKQFFLNSHQSIVRTKSRLISSSRCGMVNPNYFSTSMINFIESKKFNSCLYKKISIDENGYIKNCPSSPINYGKYGGPKTLRGVAGMGDFKRVGLITKDQIKTCKLCEFRYVCPDCRIFIDNQEDIYSKPAKCSYDPLTNQWN